MNSLQLKSTSIIFLRRPGKQLMNSTGEPGEVDSLAAVWGHYLSTLEAGPLGAIQPPCMRWLPLCRHDQQHPVLSSSQSARAAAVRAQTASARGGGSGVGRVKGGPALWPSQSICCAARAARIGFGNELARGAMLLRSQPHKFQIYNYALDSDVRQRGCVCAEGEGGGLKESYYCR
ncbi:hypothetical protein NDU88_008654 [Pleurodeles waltl]|uniref:Uncharacterized protein n=1 Tax=Pleurodeles waltl TaxID=8319 RepID=A0AAV7QQC1_PLEWA|nr:hypothetical protein NDU88_008654 [Pleurodeles waltl]